MCKKIFSALEEWAHLESMSFEAGQRNRGENIHQQALAAKEAEILALRPTTKIEAFAQLRFCATFLERNGEKACIVANTIRNAANALIWAEAHSELSV
jgi:hypothetical protein